MSYLLDTNVLSHLIRGTSPWLARRLQSANPRQLAMSAITWAELSRGVYALSGRRAAELRADLEHLGAELAIAPFDLPAAERAGEVLAQLRRSGTPIGAYDALIAGHALALGAVLVTNNVSEFRRVRGLEVEDWTTDD